MSIYSRILNQRVTKVEAQLAAQKVDDANRLTVFHEVMVEGDRALQPCMWDWILETTEPPQQGISSPGSQKCWHFIRVGSWLVVGERRPLLVDLEGMSLEW
ncbi:MAG TPA: hypothetical protein VFU48_04505 [Nitrospira sp.]|nr:hypothetical protein [Nitrospira sp.]